MPPAEMSGAVSSEVSTSRGFRDRDPPPGFDGSKPEALKDFLRELELWQWETDIPAQKHAVKLLRQLSGPAKAAASEVDVATLKTEGGVKPIIKKLEEHFSPHMEAALPRAFEKAVFGESRKGKESLQEYIIRMDRDFKALEDEGVELAAEVRGYIIYRQANLTSTQDDQVVTWTGGKYGRTEIVKALRKLEKVMKDKGGKHYVFDDDDADDKAFDPEDISDDGGSEQYVYVGEGDLDVIYEEQDLHHAMATYNQVRQALREQKTAGGYPAGGVLRSRQKGKGKGKSSEPRRVHVEQLKLRTRCARCGCVGHWARECSAPMDDYARQKSSAGSSAGASSASKNSVSTMSGRSGFCQVGENHGSHWHFEGKVRITSGECVEEHGEFSQHEKFCGLSTEAEHGIIDTAAQNGLIGKPAFLRLQEALRRQGLRVRFQKGASKRCRRRCSGRRHRRNSLGARWNQWHFGNDSGSR